MLTHIEGKETPSLISALIIQTRVHGHVSNRMFEDAIEAHPEYFPEEVEYRRKMALVPNSVCEAYLKEMQIISESYMPKLPMRGLLHYIRHPEDQPEYDAWNKEYWRLAPEREKAEADCYNKHLSPYGLTH